jgi:hypothetical protein
MRPKSPNPPNTDDLFRNCLSNIRNRPVRPALRG